MTASSATVSREEGVTLRLFAIFFALILAAPFFVYPVFIMKALCFALFACAFNLLFGYGGLLSFGHAAFFGGASYIAAHAAKVWGAPPELAVLLAVAVAALMGAAFGWLAVRRSGIYFSMVTLALAQMIYFFSLQAPFTGGEDGIQSVPRGMLFGFIDLSHTLTLYYVVVAVFLIGFAIIWRLINSPFGNVMRAIRENQPRAVSLGYRVDRFKVIAFTLSAALTGLAGATKCFVFQLASLTDVHWSMSGEVVLMTLVGGLGTLLGPVIGAFFIISLESYLAQFGAWVTFIQGAVFVICVLVFRRGMFGELLAFLERRAARRGKQSGLAPHLKEAPMQGGSA